MPKERATRERSAFGLRMLRARKGAGLTQMAVCEAMGISQGTLSELEARAEKSGYTSAFAKLYGVDAHWLATGTGPEPDWGRPAQAGQRPVKKAPSEFALALASKFDSLIPEAFHQTAYTSVLSQIQTFAEVMSAKDAPAPAPTSPPRRGKKTPHA